jgi:2-polyprenyl-3-methyl-5-hydroxy-6-metoxy-1,4-benzoquinol methylase
MNESTKQQQTTKSYFDKIAGAEGNAWSGNVDKWSSIKELFDPIPGTGEIIECGAGTGMYTIKMLQQGFHITAVDISGKALDVIRQLASDNGLDKNLTTVESDFKDFAAHTDKKFDAVTYFKTLHHFDDLKSIKEAIKLGYELLKPNGSLLGLEPNGDCPFWRPGLLLRGRHSKAKESVWEAEKGLLMITERNLSRMFQTLHDANWEFHWPYVIPAYLAQHLPVLCDPVNRFLGKTFLRRYSFNLIFKVRKTPN